MSPIPTESMSDQENSVQTTLNSRIPITENSTLHDDIPQRRFRKSILASDLFSPPPDILQGPSPRPGSPIIIATGDYSSSHDTLVIRSHTRQPSNLSISMSANDVVDENITDKNTVDKKLNEINESEGCYASEKTASEDMLMSLGNEPEIPKNPNLLIPFNLYEATPLTYKSNRRLSMPIGADEWSIAVLQQRWYQSVGSKLCISAEEFRSDALQGIEYLEAWNRTVDPKKQILHRWAMDIMDELEAHVSEPERASCHKYEDGSWKYPSAIVPELVELLPLPVEKRIQYYGQVCVMIDEVARKFSPVLKPCKIHGILGHRCVSQGCQKDMLRSAYLSQVMGEFGVFCGDIADDVKNHFHDTYSRSELNHIEEEWRDDLESKRIEAEMEEEERSLTLKRIKEGAQYSNLNLGLFTGIDESSSDSDISLISHVKQEENFEDKLNRGKSSTKPFPFQHDALLGIRKRSMASPLPLAPLTLLKPINFNWADENEDEVPEVPESRASHPESVISEDGLEIEKVSVNRTDLEVDQPHCTIVKKNLGKLLEVSHDFQAEDDSSLSTSAVLPLSIFQRDLEPYTNTMVDVDSSLLQKFSARLMEETRCVIPRNGVQCEILLSPWDKANPKGRDASLLGEDFGPFNSKLQEILGDTFEYEIDLAGIVTRLAEVTWEYVKVFAINKVLARGSG